MNKIVWLMMIAIFLYSIGFSFELWKNKNKVGSIAVFVLTVVTVIAPFFTIFKW